MKKRLGAVPPARNLWGQTLAGSILLFACAGVFERGSSIHWTRGSLAALAYLAVFGTVFTFVGLFWLIPRVPVAVIGTIPLVDMLIAVLLGAVFLGEALPVRVFLGGVLILTGVVLTARGAGRASV
jgi:drug/metabolite transporter (DMT)-like permease